MDRKALIEKLAKCQYNPIQDVKALEQFSDEGLRSLDAHCTAQSEKFAALESEKKTLSDDLTVAKADKITLEGRLRTAEAELRAASKSPSEAEWLEKAPASIKSLVERQKKVDEDKRTDLVSALKAAQGEYTEEELKAMEIGQLERMARVLKVDVAPEVDFSARGQQNLRASEDKTNVFLNPPNPYAAGLEKMKAGTEVKG